MNNYDQQKKLVTALMRFLYPDSCHDLAEEKRLLEDSGYDYDSLQKEGVEFTRQLARQEMLARANARREHLLEALKNRLASDKLRSSMSKSLADLLSSHGSDLQLAFHKLEGLPASELERIAAELSALNESNGPDKSGQG